MHKGKLLPPVYLLGFLVLAFLLHFYAPIESVITRPWNFIGIAMIVIGLSLIIASAMTFKARDTAIKPFEVSSVLIQDGLYAYSRNPIYLGMVILLFGVATFLGSASPFVAPLGMLAVLRMLFIDVEERMLEGKFGEQYRSYKARVRRWL